MTDETGLFRRTSQVQSGGHSFKALAAEFVIVVAGILLALGIDSWREQRQELTIASEHLSDVAFEVSRNLWTVKRVQEALDAKRQGLEVVLAHLKDPGSPATGPRAEPEPAQVLSAFATSAMLAIPWLKDNQFQALQNSGHLRLLRDPELANSLASTYAMPGVLFAQVERLRGRYPAVVQELLPASMQAAANPLAYYVPEKITAPVIADDEDYTTVLDAIRARRVELLSLARNEAAVCTAEWYVLERMRLQLADLLTALPPVPDSSAAAGKTAESS